MKLPKIPKPGHGIVNDTHYNHLKMTKHANFITGSTENKCNNSMEIQINTQYSKQNIKSMGKKVINKVNINIILFIIYLDEWIKKTVCKSLFTKNDF